MRLFIGGFVVRILLVLDRIEGGVTRRGVTVRNGFALGMHVLSDGRVEYPIPG